MRRLDRLTRVICIAAGVVTAAFVLSLSTYASWPLFLFVLGVMAWTSAPFLLLNRSILKKDSPLWKSVMVAVVAVVTAAFGGAAYWTGFYLVPDPRNTFLFLVIPFWQLVFIGSFLVVRKLIDAALTPRNG